MHEIINKNRSFITPATLILCAALFIVFPLAGGKVYWIRILTSVFMYAAMAAGTNILSGFAGYAALGNVLFFGIGAYGTAYLMNLRWPFFFAVLAGGAIAAVFAFTLGSAILRCKGHYFVMATLGLAEAGREIFANVKAVGGAHGLTVPIHPWGVPEVYYFYYYVMFAIMVVAVLVSWVVMRSPFGLGLRAIRADEQMAMVAGINTSLFKVYAWTLGAVFIGMAGGTYAYWNTYIEPHLVFNILISIEMFVMMMLGGMGTIIGPVVGAFVVVVLSTVVWGSFNEIHYAVLGALFLLVVLVLPRGIMGSLETLRNRLLRKPLETRFAESGDE